MNETAEKQDGHVGRHITYPDLTGARQAEGGRRLKHGPKSGTPETPLVSIVTVCFNSVLTIEQTIRSVMKQSYGNIEHLVVDAASKDGTLDLLRKYEEQLDYYVSEPDLGLYFAMNKGLELARGDYILILNSDDWYAPSCVETLVNAQQEGGADFVSALANYVDEKGEFTHRQPSFPYDGGVYFRMPLRHETMLLSRDLYNRYGPYDTRYFVNADRALTTKMYAAGVTHRQVSKPLMFFRDTGVSSTDMGKLYGERERMASRYFPGLPPEDVAVLGRLHLMRPQRLERIAREYGRLTFTKAALDYGVHRAAGAKSGDWAGYEFEELRALARSQQEEEDAVPRLRNIATLTTSDHGGAGIGSQRRVEALRREGLNAEIYCLFQKTGHAHVDRLVNNLPNGPRLKEPEIRKAWREAAVVTRDEVPDITASEMMSKAGSVVDFRDNRAIFDQADIVHMHWVVGAVDLENAGEVIGDTPVIWTLADMAAFTGGCHYSEGCEGYRNECRDCPLLGSKPGIAHETWKAKRDGYAKIKNLHVVCPSQWLADCAKASSLFGDRPVHMIPNAIPVDRFTPTNRLVARQKLNLPLDKKLVVFGAESLANKRKGGDILAEAMGILKSRGKADNVEGLFFGGNTLELGVPAHSMGHVSDEEKMSLIYAAADVFAFPSRGDNAPLTVVESLLSGTPVVGFPVGNVPELIAHEDTGYIARFEDAQDFAAGLEWALADTDSAGALLRGLRGHLKARRHNDPETAVARHIALYRQALAEAARPAPAADPTPARSAEAEAEAETRQETA